MEIGEYGRTNKGKIFIFVWVENANYILVKTRNEKQNNDILNFDKYYLDKDEEIAKHSKNIIDLIEAGDYVNGYRVYHVAGHYISVESFEKYDLCFEEQDIKTIVTHEQFESIKYKVETEE